MKEVKDKDIDRMMNGYSDQEIKGAKTYVGICNFFIRSINNIRGETK